MAEMNSALNEKSERIENLYLPLLAFFVPFLFYWKTLAQGLYWGDGIEITAASSLLAPLHPTGYPLQAILRKVFYMLPFGTIAFRSNLLNMFAGALSAAVFYIVLKQIIKLLSTKPEQDFYDMGQSLSTAVFALFGAFMFASSKLIWYNSITTEVYILHAFFILVLIKIGLDIIADGAADGAGGATRKMLLFSFILGLSFTNHLMTLALILPAIYLFVFEIKKNSPKAAFLKIFLSLIFFMLGLSLYIFLPVRASANPPLNWGDPSTLNNFLWVVSGGEFKIYRFFKYAPEVPFTLATYPGFFIERIMLFVKSLADEWITLSGKSAPLFSFAIAGIFVFFSIVGFIHGARKNRRAFVFILAAMPVAFFFLFTYNILDIEPYFLSVFPMILLFMLVAIYKYARRVGERIAEGREFLFFVFLSILGVMIFSGRSNTMRLDNDGTVEAFAVRALYALEFDSLLLAQGDNDIYPFWYFQNVENYRKDIAVVGTNFLRCGWYRKYFLEERLKELNLDIREKPVPTESAFYYSIFSDVIWKNLDKRHVYGFLEHPILKKDLKLTPVVLTLTEDEESEDEVYYPQPVLYKYGKK